MRPADIFDDLADVVVREHGGDVNAALATAEDNASDRAKGERWAVIALRLRQRGATPDPSCFTCNDCGARKPHEQREVGTDRCRACQRWVDDNDRGSVCSHCGATGPGTPAHCPVCGRGLA